LAAVLEKGYDDIPYVDPDLSVEEFWEQYEKVLNEMGWDYSVVSAEEGKNSKGYSIGIGKTRIGTDHAVVCFNGELVFDSNLSKPLQSIECYMVLVPMYPWKYNPGIISKNEYMTMEKAQ
jgi:hypothetical protein